MQPDVTELFTANLAFEQADEVWQAALEDVFPDAHIARYVPRGKGKPGTPLRAAYERWAEQYERLTGSKAPSI